MGMVDVARPSACAPPGFVTTITSALSWTSCVGEAWQAIGVALRGSELEPDVAAFYVSQLSQPLPKDPEKWVVRAGSEHENSPRPESLFACCAQATVEAKTRLSTRASKSSRRFTESPHPPATGSTAES